jgi:hypothetical protein
MRLTVEGKQKGQRGQKRQKVLFAFFALLALFASTPALIVQNDVLFQSPPTRSE